MDVSAIGNMVSTVGFPIVCTLILFWYVNKRDERDEMETQRHNSEVEALRDTLEKNTLVLQKLTDKIDMIGGAMSNDDTKRLE